MEIISFILLILVNIFHFVKSNQRKVHMTKKELAERINVDPKTLKNWETTKPELMKLIQLGLSAEKHIEDVEQYLKTLQYTKQK